MENGITVSSESSVNSAESTVRNVNGVIHTFRERVLDAQKYNLLRERQGLLDGTDVDMLNEIQTINEQMGDQKQMLINRMERQFNWISENCKQELEKLSAEEKAEAGELTTLMYTHLEKLKEELDNDDKQRIRIEWADKRSLNSLRLADKEISSEAILPEDEENGCESPTNANTVLEKRYTLPGRLTDDTDIKEDLIQLNQSTTPTDFDFHEVARPPIRPRHKVLLDRCRLIYDGKTFYRGQKLFVQTTNYTRFPAIVYALADEYVHIRSRTPGDTREVFATIDDLRAGRVRIGRKVLGSELDADPQSP